MGGGRKKKSDQINHSTGIEMLVRVGDTVEDGQPLCRVFREDHARSKERLKDIFTISDEPAQSHPLIVETITAES